MRREDIAPCMQNRELSWLKFNDRVLDEAACDELPLLERLKFVSIFQTNLDEFYMVRVGSLIDYMLVDKNFKENKTYMTPAEQLEAIYAETVTLTEKKDRLYREIARGLSNEGIEELAPEEMDAEQLRRAEKYFHVVVQPLLSPQVIDSSHPFPHIDNKQLTIALVMEQKGKKRLGLIPVPASVERLYIAEKTPLQYTRIEEMIRYFADTIFPGYTILERTVLCVTRNADIDTDTGLIDEDVDFRAHMKKILKKRARLAPVRLELQHRVSEYLSKQLRNRFLLEKEQVFCSSSPLDLSFIFKLDSMVPGEVAKRLVLAPFVPQLPPSLREGESLIKQVLKRDVLLSYPYESMGPFLKMIKEAANDKQVLSIKITLYRVARMSKLAEYLIMAAENGKEVTVLMELRARFDEQNNIEWAQRLEEAGCKVIYGFEGFKVHSKICLIVRKELSKLQYITQIGTGNYNEKTAKLYTDLSLMTADPVIGQDAAIFFNNMLLANLSGRYQKLLVSPTSLKNNLLQKMDVEISRAQSGIGGSIVMKINSLTDKEIIEKLIEASQAGVQVQLIVRGICCLLPGVKGLTDNITIISIVGRFLEHSRIYCFGLGRTMEMYIASADMMTRNTERRVEIACPVEAPALRERIYHMLDTMLHDNVKARQLQPDGRYILRTPGKQQLLCAQAAFAKEAERAAETAKEEQARRGKFRRIPLVGWLFRKE